MKKYFPKFGGAFLAITAFSQAGLFAQAVYYPHPSSLTGFPISGTSVTASQELFQAGFMDSNTAEELSAIQGSPAGPASSTPQFNVDDASGRFDITPEYGAFSSPYLNGSTYTLPLYANYKLTDRIGLSLDIPIQYTQFRSDIGTLDVWNPDVTIGLPIKVIKKTKDQPFAWTLTPHGGAGGFYAQDHNDSYSFVGHGGITSMFGYENRYFSVSMANQITFFETMTRSGSYTMVDPVNQRILKNGIKISVPFAHRWVADAYEIHTDFLNDSYVQRYETVGASVGYHRVGMKKGSYLKIGTYTELGKSFQSIHFQFGTGWKF